MQFYGSFLSFVLPGTQGGKTGLIDRPSPVWSERSLFI